VRVPEGYTWDVLVVWGDPIFPDAPEFDHETGADAESADRVFGENTDGMETFRAGGNRLLAIQHEYTNREVNLPHAADEIPTSVEDVRKLQKLQGVSVIEVAEDQTGRQVSRTVLSTAGSRTGHR
jgi:secreted PhoX family phosphatase